MNYPFRQISPLLLFLISSILTNACAQKPEQTLGNKFHKTILSKFIDPVTEEFEITKLREVSLFRNSFEVRVWVESIGGIDGFILKRSGSKWSATALKTIDCGKISYFPKEKSYDLGKINLPEPAVGWDEVWQKLFEAGILDLPDASALPNEKKILDGMSYFVEINKDGKYRTYSYGNPQHQKWPEASQMLKIGEIIADNFGLHNFKYGALCLEK